MNVSNKYGVFSAVGKESLHRKWITPQCNFDLHLIVYDQSIDDFRNDTPFLSTGIGYKFKLIYQYLVENLELIDRYEYFYFPDDDIIIDSVNIEKLFNYMGEYGLEIAQPALIDSYYTFNHTLRRKDNILRYTNFVEIMQPCFSRKALRKVLFTFNENDTGWGIDFHWGKIIGFSGREMAVIDDVISMHTRPIRSMNEHNFNILLDYLLKNNLRPDMQVYDTFLTHNSHMDNGEVDTIMQQRIERFNYFVMRQDIEKMPVGLFCGKMGLCIYFSHQAEATGDKELMKFADKLLDSIIVKLNTKTIINLEDGLIGVCLGLNYLVSKQFHKGNINYILSEMDDKIYQTAWFELMKNYPSSVDDLQSVLEIALYFSIRLQNKKLNKTNRYLYESTVIKAINQIENTYNYSDFFTEPSTYSLNEYLIVVYFYLLTIVYDLGFYNYKIIKILDEIYPKLSSSYPMIQANRIQLLSVLEVLNIKLGNNFFNKYIIRLKQDIDFSYMITNEFKNKSLFWANGVCGLYLFQNILLEKRELPESLIINKITQSDLWNEICSNDDILNNYLGLFTGLSGVILVYQKLLKVKNI